MDGPAPHKEGEMISFVFFPRGFQRLKLGIAKNMQKQEIPRRSKYRQNKYPKGLRLLCRYQPNFARS